MSLLLDGAEARCRAELIVTPRYDVDIDLTDDERFRVAATIRFGCRRPGASTFLDCDLDVSSASLNGQPLGRAIGGRLELHELSLGNEVRIEAEATYDPAARGVGRTTHQDGAVHVYTLLEPCFASRVFPCFDQPSLGGTVKLTLVTPDDWRAVSSGPLTAKEALGEGAARWSFAPTPPLPTYALAFAAGPFVELRRNDRLGLFCRRTVADRLDADPLFELTQAAIEALEELTGVAYPFEKLDLVFVPGFGGALEGAGCILLSEDFLLAGDADPVRLDTRAATIVHEIAHMWFGNLVTIRWWDELWLKEALATYFGLIVTESLSTSRSAWHLLALRYEAEARALDRLSVSHPVAVSEDDPRRAAGGYDAITYFKGAAALRQLDAQLGTGAVRTGLSAWLTAYARGAPGASSLRDQLERSSGISLGRFFAEWLEEPGVGCASVQLVTDADGMVTDARLKQSGVVRTQRLRVGAYDLVGNRLEARDAPILLVGESAELPALLGRSRPSVVLPDPDGVAYLDRRLDAESIAVLQRRLGTLEETAARVASWNALWDAMCQGSLSPQEFARAARTQTASESDAAVVELVLARAVEALTVYADPPDVASEAQDLAEHAGALAFDGGAVPSIRAASLNAFVALTVDVDGLLRLLSRDSLPYAARCAILVRLSALGAERSHEDLDPDAAASVAAAAPRAEAKEAAWRQIAAPGQPVARIQVIARGFHQPGQAELLEPYALRYAEELDGICALLQWEIARVVTAELFPRAAVTRCALEAVDSLLAGGDVPAGLERIVRERRDRLAQILDTRAVASAR